MTTVRAFTPTSTATPAAPPSEKPIRVGVFNSVELASDAVKRLLDAGFSKDQVTVVCSDETKERHFREFEHQSPAGTNTPAAVATGGAVGALLAGMTVVAAASVTGGLSLLVAGGVSSWAGGVVGGLVAAMMTRGVEKELADYYNQAVVQGKILVAAEDTGPDPYRMLAHASQIFAELGAEPLALPEG